MNLIRANEQYKVKLTDFEGPLDLLLHLTRESKLEIKTVPLSSVTAQYLEFLRQLDTLDLELASEFIEVGATLIEIKARGILPNTQVIEENPEDIENRLRLQLEEYKLLKEASEKLKVLETVGRYYKEPAQLKTEYKYILDNLNMDGLIQAFTKLMYRVERNAAPALQTQIKLDRFTVADKMKEVRSLLTVKPSIMFFDLFGEDFTKSEMINTFLALLELLKNQEIRAEQSARFGDITILKGEGYGNNGNEPEYISIGLDNRELVKTS